MAPSKKRSVKTSDAENSQTSYKQIINTKTELILQSRKHANSIFDLLEYLQVTLAWFYRSFWSITLVQTHILSIIFFITCSLKKRKKQFLQSTPVRSYSPSYWREESCMLGSCQTKKRFIKVRITIWKQLKQRRANLMAGFSVYREYSVPG